MTEAPVARLAAAEVNSAAARERLNRDLAELQARLDPRLVARAAVEQGREVVAAVQADDRRKAAVAGGAALAGLLLFRRPIARLFRRRRKVYATVRSAEPARITSE